MPALDRRSARGKIQSDENCLMVRPAYKGRVGLYEPTLQPLGYVDTIDATTPIDWRAVISTAWSFPIYIATRARGVRGGGGLVIPLAIRVSLETPGPTCQLLRANPT